MIKQKLTVTITKMMAHGTV